MSNQGQKSDRPDADLIREAKLGDSNAFSELVKRNEQMVYGFAFKVCRDREYAEETLQDTFVNVFRKLHQFDGRSEFSTWLYTIVANNCLMKRRRAKLEKGSIPFNDSAQTTYVQDDDNRVQQYELPGSGSTPLEEALSLELRQILDDAIQKLPVDYRLVFILRDLEGKSAEESAKILKLSVSAVKSRLHRARAFLREQLKEYTTT
jgi:RNA polymerase sigma-70 factor (ECF subfamily)